MKVIRPRDLSPDLRQEITRYLHEQWTRAEDGRKQQVDSDYERWDKNYKAIPLEETRSFPWHNASNLVVPLIRMHVDTFVARTLGLTFGTLPLIKATGFPEEHASPLEKYLNYKALHQWDMYAFAREFLQAGNKNGTATGKAPWVDLTSIDIMPGDDKTQLYKETEVTLYKGPRPELIPFEDFYVYPITATRPHQVQIKFHRIRYTDEQVREMCDSGKWSITFEELKSKLKEPNDVKRGREQSDAGVIDTYLHELHTIECHFRYQIQGRYYDLVGLLIPDKADDLLDLYFNPYPRNQDIFSTYRPFPRENLWFGESLPQLLEQLQEECSQIHNDRRNNSYIANAPTFVRKTGSMIPNPSTRWYPGKVWDVESMDDFDVKMMGRNYDSMLDQEGFSMQLAERLTGTNAASQGSAEGFMGKRGVYNTGGTLALMSETNDRQGINVKDFRESLSGVVKTCFILQKHFGADDPAIAFFPPKDQEAIHAALTYATSERTTLCPFEVRTSSAAMNKETDRQSLMQMAGTMNNYYGQLTQIGQQLLNKDLNAGLRMIYNDIVAGQRMIALRLLRAWDVMDPDGELPDVAAAIEKAIPGGSQGTRPSAGPPVLAGGNPGGPSPLSRAGLESVSQIPMLPTGNGGGAPS